MRKLARTIAKTLEKSDFCAVHQIDLARAWPDGRNRDAKIKQFARRYGWRLRLYQEGVCAVFDKEPPTK
jgi:hypothetical protein